MNYVDIALEISLNAHKGQTRWDNLTPYFTHPMAISQLFLTDELKSVALLHDVIEDTDVTEQELKDFGFSDDIITAVSVITKKVNEDYLDYLKRVKTNWLAKHVKIADITHNMLDIMVNYPHKIKKINKYKEALNYLIG